MLKGWEILDIMKLAAEGFSERRIAKLTGLSRNTVSKYLHNPNALKTNAVTSRKSKLDPFKSMIKKWVTQDGITNCQVLLRKIRALGYQGGHSILRAYVHEFRPARQPGAVMRYETPPGDQAQVDFGEVRYRGLDGKDHRLYCFVMVLSYSRDVYLEFCHRADADTFLACHVRALIHFGGVARRILYDNAKVVRVGTQIDGQPLFNSRLYDLARALGFIPVVHRPYRPQTKGKVENQIRYVKQNFWPGREFTDLLDLNHQALAWCGEVGERLHGTTGEKPSLRRRQERLGALPPLAVLQPFLVTRHKVSRDGFISYDGIRYGVPWQVSGRHVKVLATGRQLEVFDQDKLCASHARGIATQRTVPLAGQWDGIPLIRSERPRPQPLGWQVASGEVAVRPLADYEAIAGGLSR